MKIAHSLLLISTISISTTTFAQIVVQKQQDGKIKIFNTQSGKVITDDAKVVNSSERIEAVQLEIENEDELEESRSIFPVVSLRAGVDTVRAGSAQNILITPTDPSRTHFTTDNTWSSVFVWGLLAGIEIPFGNNDTYRWQSGVAFYSTPSYEVSGQVNPNGNPSIVDYHYSYSVETQRIMFENKLLVGLNEKIYLYFLGGIGEAINKATGFKYNSVDPAVPQNDIIFENNTNYSLSYSFGLGLEWAVVESIRLGLGYQYSDFGKIKLGHMRSTGTTSETIQTDSTPAHEVLLNLTYVFN